jgi:phosphoribosyl 1,2-cyclic phosphodiesterase
MRVDVCGVRGSTPAPGPEFAGVGGETSCVALSHDAEERPRLVLDAGTGLRRVTSLLGGEPFRGTILLGHLHWDHTHGLPFFRGGDREDASTTVLLPEQGVAPVELLDRFMGPPMFPVTFEGLRGNWTTASLEEGWHEIEGYRVLAREIPHKGGRTFGYRVMDETGSLAYLSDHGPRGALGPGPDGWGPYHEAAMELCAGVDLLIHDAQHTGAELPARADFGHSAADYAVELGRRAGAGTVLLFHHDPERTDEEVSAMAAAVSSPGAPAVAVAVEHTTWCLGGTLTTNARLA